MAYFLLTDIKASRFDESSKFLFGYGSIVIKVTADEGLVNVKAWSFIESLSELLAVGLNLEVSSPEISEFDFGFAKEDIVSGVESASHVVRGTTVDEGAVVGVEWGEGIAELGETNAVVVVLVVAFHVELEFINGWVEADFIQSLLYVT